MLDARNRLRALGWMLVTALIAWGGVRAEEAGVVEPLESSADAPQNLGGAGEAGREPAAMAHQQEEKMQLGKGEKHAPPAAAKKGGLSEGWERFGDYWFLLDMAIVLLLSMLLASIIAYHPLVRGKAATIEEIEQPKTFIIYALVGAISGQIVLVDSNLAFVIFGIGGLMRFRTDVGETKDTGRVILVTVVGVCCGLKLYVVGVLATLFGWFLIYYLERQRAGRLMIKGLDSEVIAQAADIYRKVLVKAGCVVIGSKKNMNKGNVSFVFKAPRQLDREAVEGLIHKLPKQYRGAIDWEIR